MGIRERYRAILKKALERSPFRRREPVYRVGDYYADYSGLTEAEMTAAQPPEIEELFRNSTSVNRR
jgi:hypothetical protein